MHIVVASIAIALGVLLLVLIAFWLFTVSPYGQRVDHSNDRGPRRNRPRFG